MLSVHVRFTLSNITRHIRWNARLIKTTAILIYKF